MNEVTKKALEKVIGDRQYTLRSIENRIANIKEELTREEDYRNRLIKEIEAYEADLNK